MEAPAERLAYTLLLSPDHSKPDALAVVDVDRGSPNFGKAVYRLDMPYRGDEFHHFGWNACSSALSPFSSHPFAERRYLIIPGIRSSRIYIVDTKPDPARPTIVKTIEPEEVFHRTGYSRPHTVHCGPEGIYVSTLGGGGADGDPGSARRIHHGLRDVRNPRALGDRPRPAEAALRLLVEPAAQLHGDQRVGPAAAVRERHRAGRPARQ